MVNSTECKSESEVRAEYEDRISKLKVALQRVSSCFNTHEITALKEQVTELLCDKANLHASNLSLRQDLAVATAKNVEAQNIKVKLAKASFESRILGVQLA